MKNKTIFSILVLLLVLLNMQTTYAQKDMKIGLQLGNFYSPNLDETLDFSWPITIPGVFIEYPINERLGIKAGYSRWMNVFGTGMGPLGQFALSYADKFGGSFVNWEPGTIVSWINYNLFDLSLHYNTSIKRHQFFVGAGPSVTFGKNDVITRVYRHPDYFDVLAESKIISASYTGFMYEAGYNYSIMHNMATVGMGLSGRKYISAFAQYTANVMFSYKIPLQQNKRQAETE